MICGQSSMPVSGKPAGAVSRLNGLSFSTSMLLGKRAYNCLPLRSVRRMINTHLHWGSMLTRVQSSVQASQSAASNSTCTQPFNRISCLWNRAQNKHRGTLGEPQHFSTFGHIPFSAVCGDWCRYLWTGKKMVMLRKQHSVCYNLTCNGSGGLSGRAWGTEWCQDVCVDVFCTLWVHVCMRGGGQMRWVGRGSLPTVHQD